MKYFLVTGILLISLLSPHFSRAQEKGDKPTIPLDHFYAKPENNGWLRKVLTRLNFTFSTGYGRTYYNQNLTDFALLQQADSLPFIFGKDFNITGGTVSSGYDYWFNDVREKENVNFNSATDFLVSSDTTKLAFKAPGMNIPLNFSVHAEFDRYKVGGGFAFEYHRPGTFRPTVFEDRISTYEPNFGSTFFKKYYLLLGAKVYRYHDYVLSADAHIGSFKLSKKFNKEIIQKGVYVNIGATVDRELSEYLKVFVRPSFEIKGFKTTPPGTDFSISQSMNAIYFNIGVTYRIPELRKCFLKSCTTQVNHQHGNREYRSRKHPFYKKQNPHYGENYPRLIKYKRKNRNKLEPY